MNDPAIAALASAPLVLVLLAAWGFGEAVALPVVPDVLLGLIALATPAAVGWPLVSAIVGGVLGAWAFAALRRSRPGLVRAVLSAQPGLGLHGLVAARERVARDGATRAFAQIGPGLPLKAWLDALLELHPTAGWAAIGGLALLNRLARLAPVAAAFALVGTVTRPLGVPTAVVVPVYLVGWAIFYAGYWWSRRAPASQPL